MQYKRVLFLVSLLFLGCQDEVISEAGSHYQNRDCLECHNGNLTQDKYLRYGGTIYSDKAAHPDDMSKLCNKPTFIQLLTGSTSVYDGRDDFTATDSGALGRGNLYLLESTNTIPTGLSTVRIILEDGTVLAQTAGTHSFNGSYDVTNSADASNQYSCNACHRTGGSKGLMYIDQNLSFCLESPSDVSVSTYFEAESFPLLNNKCGACHTTLLAGSAFQLTLSDIPATRTNMLISSTTSYAGAPDPGVALINRNTASLSGLFTNCPSDTNHTAIGTTYPAVKAICDQTGSDYERIVEWINLEP